MLWLHLRVSDARNLCSGAVRILLLSNTFVIFHSVCNDSRLLCVLCRLLLRWSLLVGATQIWLATAANVVWIHSGYSLVHFLESNRIYRLEWTGWCMDNKCMACLCISILATSTTCFGTNEDRLFKQSHGSHSSISRVIVTDKTLSFKVEGVGCAKNFDIWRLQSIYYSRSLNAF